MASAERNAMLENLVRRGYFAARSAVRLSKAAIGGLPLEDALEAEKGHFKAHRRASKRRQAIGKGIDAASEVYGEVLGWHSVLGVTTTPECRAAHGKNFRATDKPAIGYPGSTHPNCKCSVRAPWPGGMLLR